MNLKKVLPALIVFIRITGALCLVAALYFIYERFAPNRFPEFRAVTTPTKLEEAQIASHSGQLARLTIPSIQLSLPVSPAEQKKNGDWIVTKSGLNSLSNDHTGQIVFGHNWASILGKLKQVNVGDTFIAEFVSSVLDQSNQQRKVMSSITSYKVVAIHVVDPKQTELLKNIGSNTMLLYTCTGFLDRERLAVIAEKVE